MKIHTVSLSVVLMAVGVAGCTSTAGMGPASFNIKYFGQCGALYDGDKLVTRYSGRTGKRTAYATGKGCSKSHPDAETVSFSLLDTISLGGFFVRGERTNKEGVTRRTIIRKEGARYVVRSSVLN
jgi:hypothetical protein